MAKLPKTEGPKSHIQPCFCIGCRLVRAEDAAKKASTAEVKKKNVKQLSGETK
jgi:hypothetical protein